MDRAPEPEESPGLSNLEPEIRLAIKGRVDRELARRAIPGSLGYFLVCVVTAISTPYYADHPFALVLAGSLMLLVGGLRLLGAGAFLRLDSALVCRSVDRHVAAALHRGHGRWGIFYPGAGPFPRHPLPHHFAGALSCFGAASGRTAVSGDGSA